MGRLTSAIIILRRARHCGDDTPSCGTWVTAGAIMGDGGDSRVGEGAFTRGVGIE